MWNFKFQLFCSFLTRLDYMGFALADIHDEIIFLVSRRCKQLGKNLL